MRGLKVCRGWTGYRGAGDGEDAGVQGLEGIQGLELCRGWRRCRECLDEVDTGILGCSPTHLPAHKTFFFSSFWMKKNPTKNPNQNKTNPQQKAEHAQKLSIAVVYKYFLLYLGEGATPPPTSGTPLPSRGPRRCLPAVPARCRGIKGRAAPALPRLRRAKEAPIRQPERQIAGRLAPDGPFCLSDS